MEYLEKSPVAVAKNFIRSHKTALTVVATASVTAFVTSNLHKEAAMAAHMFIVEKGLSDEFLEYIPPTQ